MMDTLQLRKVALPSAGASLGTLMFGYHLAVVNLPLATISKELGFFGDSYTAGLVVSVALFGALIGSLSAAFLSEIMDSKKALLLSLPLFLIGSHLCSNAYSVSMLLTARAIVGFAMGAVSVLAPVLISETAPLQQRSTLLSITQLFVNIGVFMSSLAAFPLTSDASWWRSMFVLPNPALYLCLACIAFTIMPLKSASMKIESIENTDVEIAENSNDAMNTEINSKALFNVHYRWLLFVGSFLFVLQQLSGVNGLIFFSGELFRAVNIQSEALGSSTVSFALMIGTIAASRLLNRLGKKVLLLISFISMCISWIVLQIGFALGSARPFVVITALLMYMVSFAVGAGPLPAVVLPELFPLTLRARATAIGFSVYWTSNLIFGLIYLPIAEVVGFRLLYAFFAICSAFGAWFVHSYLPSSVSPTAIADDNH